MTRQAPAITQSPRAQGAHGVPPGEAAGAADPAAHASRRMTVALFLAFLGFYLLATSGHFYATDEETFFRTTESIVERHTLALPEGAWGLAGSTGVDGKLYPGTSPGQSLAAIPLYLVGKLLAPLFPANQSGYILRFCAGLLGIVVTALTIALLHRLARRLGYRERSALALAVLYGLATTAWPHGRTFYAEPLTALCFLIAFYAIQRGTALDSPRWLLFAGMAAIAGTGVKPQAALALPGLGLYLVFASLGPVTRGDLPTAVRRLARQGALWFGGGVLAALPLFLYNTVLFGGPLTTGYGDVPGALFTTPFLTGLYGLTVSSGKGLLWYSPPILLAVLGGWAFFRRQRAAMIGCLAIIAVHLAFYSRLDFWHGDAIWGPRYLMPMLPFALLPLLGFLEPASKPAIASRPTARRSRTMRLATTLIVAILGIGVQLPGLFLNFDYYFGPGVTDHERYFEPAHSPIVWHTQTLVSRVNEWRDYAFPPADTATLTSGFAERESDKHSTVFPRWTTGAGAITIHPAGAAPLTVKLTLFDHRPAALRDRPAILVGGTALPDDAIERASITADGTGQTLQFTVPAEAVHGGEAIVTIRSATWNPAASGQGDRNEDLGLFVHNVEIWRAGTPLAVRDIPAKLRIDPMLDTPRQRFWWFNNDHERHHLIDWWAWYAAVAGFGPQTTARWIGGYATFASALLLTGLILGWRTLPHGWLRYPGAHRTRRARPRPRPAPLAVGHRRTETER